MKKLLVLHGGNPEIFVGADSGLVAGLTATEVVVVVVLVTVVVPPPPQALTPSATAAVVTNAAILFIDCAFL
jgi:hypothetical protein